MDIIARVNKMESVYDELSFLLRENNADGKILNSYHILKEYYESPLWRQDFEADERGMIPSYIKRGVLSEDGVYNLLSEAEERLRANSRE